MPIHIGAITLQALVCPGSFSDEARVLDWVFKGSQLAAELFETSHLGATMLADAGEI